MQNRTVLFSCLFALHEGWAGTFYTNFCPAWRKTVQPKRMRPASKKRRQKGFFMKREDVKKQIPNITDEQLDWLMGENGRDITAEKTKATNLQIQVNGLTTQLNTAKDSLKAFEGVDVADLKGQITKLQGQLADQADSFAFDSALDGAIRDAHGRDVKAIRGMLDVDALKASKDRTTDIEAALDALTKEKAWAFDAAPGGYPNVRDGGDPNKTPTGSTREQFAEWFNEVMK
jgi:phage minor structural protein GP20